MFGKRINCHDIRFLGLYKPRRQVRGEGVAEMSTLLNNGCKIKVSTKRGGGSKMPRILSTWFVHALFIRNPPSKIRAWHTFWRLP